MKKNKLPPIDFSQDLKKYGAKQYKTNVNLKKCKHKQVEFEDGVLKCSCGVGWQGERLHELYQKLTKQ